VSGAPAVRDSVPPPPLCPSFCHLELVAVAQVVPVVLDRLRLQLVARLGVLVAFARLLQPFGERVFVPVAPRRLDDLLFRVGQLHAIGEAEFGAVDRRAVALVLLDHEGRRVQLAHAGERRRVAQRQRGRGVGELVGE
jgi:hypothetical protein